ncbi:MAG: hypothetical protein LCH61_19390 [Proteobacteria bacterium]|nr:hypothetical protein [Pseudomonadota bacterium]
MTKVHGFAVLAACFALAGCNAISPTLPSLGGGGGSGLGSQALFGNPQNVPRANAPELEIDYNCPGVEVMEGAAAVRVGRAGSSEVAHQASLTDVARECRFSGNQMVLKVGVQGRMLIGSIGKPGTYPVPVRVAVKQNDKVVANRVARVSVTIPAGESSVGFVHVEDNIILPILPGADPADTYDVFVGFDGSGAAADPRRGRRRR